MTGEPKFSNRGCGIADQPFAVGRIAPSLSDDLSPVPRTDFGLVSLDEEIKCFRVDVPFLGQYRFKRPHTRLDRRKFRTVLVVIMVIMVMLHGNLAAIWAHVRQALPS